MPIIKSAKKRVKVAAKARSRNARTKRTMRESLKAFSKAVDAGKAADIQKTQRDAVSAIDMAAKNKAARQNAALSAQAKAAGAKPVKSAAKPAAKKAPAKKPAAAKKAPLKKPAAGKKTVKKTSK
jgi:ribosomal protein S20